MSYNFDDPDYEWFKTEFYKLSKIQLNKYKQDQMKRRISTYIFRRYKSNYQDFLALISKNREEFDSFLEYLTINVSEFFRNIEQWDILKNEIIPIIQDNKSSHIRIWSSACSSGKEPYSLDMLCTQLFKNQSFEIIATDIDESIIKKAKKAVYKLESLEKIPQEYRKWFLPLDYEMYKIAPEITNRVTLKN